MHIYLALAALAHIQSIGIVNTAPLTATPITSVVIADTESHHPIDGALALISNSLNASSTALSQSSSIESPSKSNTTLSAPQGLIPYHVKGSSTTLLFHSFGITIPSSYLLQCLSLSLSLVLEVTLDGRGRDLITNGFFIHTHMIPNGENVTITVADFRESGRPMNFNNLRDTLSGIGDFVTEPEQGITTLSYEVDVEEKGYVGTGHVDYIPAANSV